jgi:ankyrin repeat protein
LHVACSKGDIEVAQFLIARGSKLEALDKDRRTPLFLAAINGHQDLVRILIGHGANADVRDWCRDSVLHACIDRLHSESVRVLVDSGVDLDSRDSDGRTPLLVLVLKWRSSIFASPGGIPRTLREKVAPTLVKELCFEMMQILIDNGADAGARDTQGKTAVHVAASCGDTALLSLLFKGGASINIRDIHDQTPLHYAVRYDSPDIVDFLVRNGADLRIINSTGTSVLTMARIGGNPKIIESLNKHRVVDNSKTTITSK